MLLCKKLFIITNGELITTVNKELYSFTVNVTQTSQKEVEVEKVKDFESSLLSFMDSEYEDLMKDITESGRYDDETEKSFKEALDKFVKTQSW